MALKAVLDTIEGVPADVAKEYTKGEDGKFRLTVDGMVGADKLAEFRTNNIRLMQEMEKFKDIDPAKYKELLAIQQEITEQKLIKAGKVDEVVESRVQTMRKDFETKLNEASNQLSSANRQLETLLVDNTVRAAAIKAGVLPTAVDDVLLRAKSVFKVQNGAAVPVNEKGEVIYGKDGTSPMSVDDWMSTLKKTATHLWPASQGGGANRSGPQGSGRDTSRMTPTQKIEAGLTGQ